MNKPVRVDLVVAARTNAVSFRVNDTLDAARREASWAMTSTRLAPSPAPVHLPGRKLKANGVYDWNSSRPGTTSGPCGPR